VPRPERRLHQASPGGNRAAPLTVSRAELRARREALGLGIAATAKLIGWSESQLKAAEAGRPWAKSLTADAMLELAGLENTAARFKREIEDAALMRSQAGEPEPLDVAVYEHDEIFWVAYPEAKPFPAAAHRAAAAQARRWLRSNGVGVRLLYPGEN
jgi:hypothetical protein